MKHVYFIPALLSALAFTACSDNDTLDTDLPEAYVYIELVTVPEGSIMDETYDSLVVNIDPDCTECIAWLKANLNIDLNNIDL